MQRTRTGAALVREVFGNPWRLVTVPEGWLVPSVVQVARAIYEGRHWREMPVLADTLEDAGCDDASFLAHARSGGPHHRGCWLVDALLGMHW